MFQENVTAVVIRNQDYKDNDKMLRLFSLENGVVSAVIKGVKKSNAKLKFASQLFAFCNFSLVKNPKTGYLTVAGASQIEDMFALTFDMDKFLPACVCLEAVDCAVKDEANTEIFILLLKTFKTILYSDDVNPTAAASFFLTKLLSQGGYTNFENANTKSIASKMCLAIEPSAIAPFSQDAATCFKDIAKMFERCFSVKLNTLSMI